MPSIAAVIVTYNRAELIIACLSAVFSQTRPPDRVILVNNASTDNTLDLLKNKGFLQKRKLEVITLTSNTGGAGGFHAGIKQACVEEFDYVWAMDDDVIPKPDALEELLRAHSTIREERVFLSSVAFDENEALTVNVPTVNTTPVNGIYPNWAKLLDKGIVEINVSTFVSIFIPTSVIRDVGLPIKELFIWGDDTEYTLRMSKNGVKGYYVGPSRVLHLRPGIQGLDIRREENNERIRLYEFFYRNTLYLSKSYRTQPASIFIYKSIIRAASCLIKQRHALKTMTIIKGLVKGLFFKPTPEKII